MADCYILCSCKFSLKYALTAAATNQRGRPKGSTWQVQVSSSPTEPYTSLHHVFGMTCYLNLALFPNLCHHCIVYCIVSIHLYSASCSSYQSEALPVRETQREESIAGNPSWTYSPPLESVVLGSIL